MPARASRGSDRVGPAIVATPGVTAGIRELSDRLGRPAEEIRSEIGAAIAEMAVQHAVVPAWVWRRLGRRLLRNYELRVDEHSLAQLRELDHEYTLV